MIELHLFVDGDREEAGRLRELLAREGFRVSEQSGDLPPELGISASTDCDPDENSHAARQIEDLEVAVRELRNLDVAKSQFLANVSHELRTPLTAIVTYGEILRDGLLGDLNDRQREAVQSVIGSSRQLLTMIEEILIYAKASARVMELEMTTFPVQEVIAAVHDMSASLIRKKGLRCEILVDEDLPPAHADRDKVLHILSNLVGNAIEFTPPPEGLIQIRATRSGRNPDWITISVEDNGIGIDPGHHDLIFREFAQVDSSRARKHHGTGLGLAIARNFVLLHHGEIGVESELGSGSRFQFTIPSVEASEESRES